MGRRPAPVSLVSDEGRPGWAGRRVRREAPAMPVRREQLEPGRGPTAAVPRGREPPTAAVPRARVVLGRTAGCRRFGGLIGGLRGGWLLGLRGVWRTTWGFRTQLCGWC
ncbi:hypothetical protein GCM10009534_33780 [Kribbella sandramycini]